MEEFLLISGLTLAAGGCIPLGGLVASIEHIRPHWLENELRHFIIALGGGVLLGAVAMVLIPEGMSAMRESLWVFPVFLTGGFVFYRLERALGMQRRESPQLTGMLLDYVPEAMALGGLLATGSTAAPLLALLIGLQNLPEGFNTYRELLARNGNDSRRTLMLMLAMVPLGPAAGLLGFYFLADYDFLLGTIMIFAAGGMLYLIFQDIAPQSRLSRHWLPPLGAVAGFGLAVIGHLLTKGAEGG